MNRMLAQIALIAFGAALPALAQDGTFNYQGLLKDSGVSVSGQVDLEFSLFDAETTGTQIGATLSVNNVDVIDGLFSVDLDFGAAALIGGVRWLEIAVANPAGGSFTTLSPRQPLTASPYAIQTRGIAVDDLDNVGIGTSSPLAPLHVEGVARASSFSVHNPNNVGASVNLSWLDDVPRIHYGGNGVGNQNGFAIHGTGDAVKLRLLNSGALGVGTDTPTSVISTAKLAVASGHVAIYNDYGLFSYNSTGNGIGAGLDTTTTDDLALYAGGVSRMTVESSGDVGIGTTNPVAALDVRGRLVLDDGGDALVYTAATGGEQSRYMKILNSTTLSSASGLMAGGVLVSNDYGYASPGKSDLIVKGTVGIGTASPGSVISNSKLDIEGGHILLSNNYGVFSANTGGTGIGAGMDSTTNDDLELFAGGASRITVDNSGDVGIGTSSPAATLHIASDAFPNAQITQTDNTDFARLMLDGNGSMFQLNVGAPGASSPDTFNIYRPGVGNILSIPSTGRVGIGTTLPAAKLHVRSIEFTGVQITQTNNSDYARLVLVL